MTMTTTVAVAVAAPSRCQSWLKSRFGIVALILILMLIITFTVLMRTLLLSSHFSRHWNDNYKGTVDMTVAVNVNVNTRSLDFTGFTIFTLKRSIQSVFKPININTNVYNYTNNNNTNNNTNTNTYYYYYYYKYYYYTNTNINNNINTNTNINNTNNNVTNTAPWHRTLELMNNINKNQQNQLENTTSFHANSNNSDDYSSCVISSHSSHNVRVKSPRVEAMLKLLSDYKAAHNLDVMRNEEPIHFCRRKFVYVFVMCLQYGNMFGNSLTALTSAVVLNYTAYVRVSKANKLASCADQSSLAINRWMIREGQIEALARQKGCHTQFDGNSDAAWPELNPVKAKQSKLFGNCPLSNVTFWQVDGLNNPTYLRFNTEVMKRAFGNDSYQARASRILFSNPLKDVARFESYGFVQHELLFDFELAVKERAKDQLTRMFYEFNKKCHRHESIVSIAVHVRHQWQQSLPSGKVVNNSVYYPEVDIPYDDTVMVAMEHMVNALRKEHCVFLLASDRVATVQRIWRKAESLGCEVRYVKKAVPLWDYQPKSNSTKMINEHGPFDEYRDGVADWFLLGHAQYLIGPSFSTFTQLIANTVAYKLAMEGESETNDTSKSTIQRAIVKSPLLWLPLNTHGGLVENWFDKRAAIMRFDPPDDPEKDWSKHQCIPPNANAQPFYRD